MRRGYKCLCTAVLLASAAPAVAQQYSFRHYGAAEGLQNLSILSLAQDGEGYLWAGTEAGLYRYDGTRFRMMAAADGLACATEARALFTASDGALWVNTCNVAASWWWTISGGRRNGRSSAGPWSACCRATSSPMSR